MTILDIKEKENSLITDDAHELKRWSHMFEQLKAYL